MTNIQKKSLQHISELLKSVDSYQVYSAITSVMGKEGIDPKIINNVIGKYKEAMNEQTEKVSEARDWIDTIISDQT